VAGCASIATRSANFEHPEAITPVQPRHGRAGTHGAAAGAGIWPRSVARRDASCGDRTCGLRSSGSDHARATAPRARRHTRRGGVPSFVAIPEAPAPSAAAHPHRTPAVAATRGDWRQNWPPGSGCAKDATRAPRRSSSALSRRSGGGGTRMGISTVCARAWPDDVERISRGHVCDSQTGPGWE
jgi:hypothetical protein